MRLGRKRNDVVEVTPEMIIAAYNAQVTKSSQQITEGQPFFRGVPVGREE